MCNGLFAKLTYNWCILILQLWINFGIVIIITR